jgi:hypothetical protein
MSAVLNEEQLEEYAVFVKMACDQYMARAGLI